jgi:hypothetical protein
LFFFEVGTRPCAHRTHIFCQHHGAFFRVSARPK